MQRVMVTGAAGYIGGQTMLALQDAGHWIMAVDRRPVPGHLRSVADRRVQADFASQAALDQIESQGIAAVIHCAGTSLVGPSVTDPADYYQNNFVRTKALADYILEHNLTVKLIYSSSAAVYGEPIMTPCQEIDPPAPISPYGKSKLMVEWLLSSYQQAYGLGSVSFRYFNACGADPAGRHGQEPGATHIIARVLESARDNLAFGLYGTDYDTADGTCVRDYVHVADIAQAHVQALSSDSPLGVFNLGTAQGHSNREVIATAERVVGRSIWVTAQDRRPGDPAVLTAAADQWTRATGWRPQYSLEEIIHSAWKWYRRGV